MKTYDNVEVEEGSTVWVFGSMGLNKTTILPPVTNYTLYGNKIPVNQSFSTSEAAVNFHLKGAKS